METVSTETVPVRRERDMERVYRQVNDAWGMPRREIPAVPDGIARRAVHVLYRLIMEQSFEGEIVLKHRGRSWVHGPLEIVVNTRRGWWLMVHDLAHQLHQIKNPGLRPHDPKQALIERAMIEEVVMRGWLSEAPGSRREAKPVRDIKRERYARVLARLAAWQKKKRRAETAIRKLKRQARYYDRTAER